MNTGDLAAHDLAVRPGLSRAKASPLRLSWTVLLPARHKSALPPFISSTRLREGREA